MPCSFAKVEERQWHRDAGKEAVKTRKGTRERTREKENRLHFLFFFPFFFFVKQMPKPDLSIRTHAFGAIPSQSGFTWLRLKVPWCHLPPDHFECTCDMADVFWYVLVNFSQRSLQPSCNTKSGSARAVRHRRGPARNLHSALNAETIGENHRNSTVVRAVSWNEWTGAR